MTDEVKAEIQEAPAPPPVTEVAEKEEEVATEAEGQFRDGAMSVEFSLTPILRIRGGGKLLGVGTPDGGSGRKSRRDNPYGALPTARTTLRATGAATTGNKNRRVYVGNLSWHVSWQDLKDYFADETGEEVVHADVLTGPDGRSKGCGIVEFASEEGAQKAVLTLNDTELQGRQIFVREDREDRSGVQSSSSGGRFSGDISRRVYVGNLSWEVAWQDLKDHMREAGEVLHAEVITEAGGRSKGCGVVEYKTSADAKNAIDTMNDTEFMGRMIFVREDRETGSGPPGGSRSGGGGGRHNSSGGTSVYVWNLSYETSWQDLKDHARRAGNVDSATILTGSEGRSIGCGVVQYQHPKEAERAIRELQNTMLNSRPIRLRFDRHSGDSRGATRNRGPPPSSSGGGSPSGTQLFVSNLSWDTSWQGLKDHFRGCGTVLRADVKEDRDGRKKGFGIVRFSTAEEAQRAIEELNGVELDGRELTVRLDERA